MGLAAHLLPQASEDSDDCPPPHLPYLRAPLLLFFFTKCAVHPSFCHARATSPYYAIHASIQRRRCCCVSALWHYYLPGSRSAQDPSAQQARCPERLLTSLPAHGPKAVSTAPSLVELLLAKPRELAHNGRGGLLSTVDPLRRRPRRQRQTSRRALDRASAATDIVTGTTFGGVAIKLDAGPCCHPQGRFFDSTRPAS